VGRIREWFTGTYSEGSLAMDETHPTEGMAGFEDPVLTQYEEEQARQVLAEGMNIDPEGRDELRSELGSSGNTAYGNLATKEYNSELVGWRGIKIYDQMRRSDAQVRATLRLVKTPITAAQWYIDPAGDTARDLEIAAFVEWALFKRLKTSWPKFLWEALYMLDFGFYDFEKVFAFDTWTPPKTSETARPRKRPVVVWDDFGPRHPRTVMSWDFFDNGDVKAMIHQKITGVGETENVPIPVDRLLMFILDEEAGDPEGMSILRSAYKHWYYKENLYKIDAIQKERHGIGIPMVTLPINFTQDDKIQANKLGMNLRTNEKAHITVPPGWEVGFAELQGQPVDALESAEHHNHLLAQNILAPFLDQNRGTGSATAGTAGDQVQMFMKSLRYVADILSETLHDDAIKELVDFNYPDVQEYPRLKYRRIGENADWRALSAALKNLVDSQLLTPDDETENHIRETFDLPQMVITSKRSSEDRLESLVGPPQENNMGPEDDSSEQAARQGNTSAEGDRTPPEGSS